MTDSAPIERRTRTASWVPPAERTRFLRESYQRGATSEELHAALLRGEVPVMPAWDYLGIRAVAGGGGKAVCELTPGEHLANAANSVQGGVVCALIDAAMTMATSDVRPSGTFDATLEMKVNFVRPVPATAATVRCEAEAEYVGRTTAVTRARVVDDAGRLYATAMGTTMFVASQAQRERVERQAATETEPGD
jgi:uncharacterized protein (TIGR00369 family)